MPLKILLFVVFLLGLVFTLAPSGPAFDFFLLSEARCTGQEFVYYGFEHLTIIILAFIIRGAIHGIVTKVFFWLCVADFVDFVLTYNSIWFHVGLFPVSMNTLTVAIFTATILHDR